MVYELLQIPGAGVVLIETMFFCKSKGGCGEVTVTHNWHHEMIVKDNTGQ